MEAMEGQLVLHCGGKAADRLALAEVIHPEETDTYKPVPHLELIEKVDGIAQDLLRRTLVRESFGLARDGRQMFGVLTYRNGEDEDMGLSIGIRNSYDKSMSIGVALGGRVFVCDNLAISGEIRIVRKHTQGVWQAIEDMCISTLYKHAPVWNALKADVDMMKQVKISDLHGHELLGRLIGAEVLSPRQIPVAYREWDHPTIEDFTPRNLWSLYNSVNAALKTSPVAEIMERHRLLHQTIVELH
jgi:hypothetical protein